MVALLFVFPLAFAYAVVKHRVLEIPVLLKRSARYLLVQRGFVVLLALVSIALTFVFASSFERYFQPLIAVAQPAGIAVGAMFGTALLWGGLQVHKHVSARIDRAFFRSAYDARLILGDLAERARTTTDRVELAHLLERHIEEALHPNFVLVYLRASDGSLAAVSGVTPRELATISPNMPVLVKLAQSGQAHELPWSGDDGAGESTLVRLHAECLAPMLGRRGGLAGLLVLGPRLSEEPYSGEDKRLLTAVASQAGTALENLHLAEEIAERMEGDRRIAREMEIAKAVQARLLPQVAPQLKTLDCAGRCLQARSVGGDYYDFLRLGPGHVGLALADVSGKGVHAALLMATLQAHLHNQSGITPLDPVQSIRQVNRMLWECTDPQHYATMFFGIYDDCSRRLQYVNCGHNPPVYLHRDGTVERLEATATVIGVFEQWECTAKDVQLAPGDLLVLFSDGVTEAMHGLEEFGEDRLVDEVRAQRCLPVDEIVTAIFSRVLEFSAGAQSDDLTVLVARVRGESDAAV